MLNFVVAIIWGTGILLSFIGYGNILAHIAFKYNNIDWGQKAAWGICFIIFIGGLLNLSKVISPTIIFFLISIGVILYALGEIISKKQILIRIKRKFNLIKKDRLIVVLSFLLIAICVIRIIDSVSYQSFNLQDDLQGYFVFPTKMLELGAMGEDPFSERRIVSSLGGNSFLQAIILTILPHRNLDLLEGGIGFLVVLGLIYGFMYSKGLSTRIRLIVLILFSFIHVPKVNITSVIIAFGLFFAFFRALDFRFDKNRLNGIRIFVLALLIAGISSIKSNYIPPCFVIIGIFYLHLARKTRTWIPILEGIYTVSLAIIMCIPWMISMKESSGTFLFPLLGKGYHGSAYSDFANIWEPVFNKPYAFWIFFKSLLIPDFFIALLLFSFWLKYHQKMKSHISANILLAAILSSLINTFSMVAEVQRYNFPFLIAAIIFHIIQIAVELKSESRVNTYHFNLFVVNGIIILFSFVFLLGDSWKASIRTYTESILNLKDYNKKNLIDSELERNRYVSMVKSIPNGEKIIARLEKPYLLPFRNHNIYIVDYPGGASLPSGMPFRKGSEPLAEYLLSKSIRYVMYSYANHCQFGDQYLERLNLRLSWIRSEAEHTFDFQDNLVQLARTRKKIYDDGDIYILDLTQRIF